jgi:hypothetical protein
MGATSDPLPFFNHISQVNAYAVFQSAGFWKLGIPLSEFPLDFNGAVYGMDYTGKFSKQIISWGINDSSLLLFNQGGHHLSAAGQCSDGCVIIFAHKAAVARNIGTENGGKFAFKGFWRHGYSCRLACVNSYRLRWSRTTVQGGNRSPQPMGNHNPKLQECTRCF